MNADPSALIAGAGFAGIAAAIELRSAGVTDITILEKANELGGVWRENTYPGAACDVPSPYYSLSYAPNPDWPTRYSLQPDILGYLQRTARSYRLHRHIRFGTELVEAAWDETTSRWDFRTAAGEKMQADIFVPAVGQLSRPVVPHIPGAESFRGPAFHSARWDHSCEFRGRRIAVIGTGASAIQFVPQLQPVARGLTVFQRSAPYIVPKPDTGYGPLRNALFRTLPAALGAERLLFWGIGETATLGLAGNEAIASAVAGIAERLRRREIRDPGLRAKLTPDYHIGCKRVLFSNDYYPALAAANVRLETADIDGITPDGPRTADGTVHPADVLVYGTGFDATGFLEPIRVTGRDGKELHRTYWSAGARAHLGMTVPGFPNMFCMYGPNTNLGSGSILHMVESQARYLAQAARYLSRHPGAALDVRPDVEQSYDEEIQGRIAASVWTRCTSWYRQADGRVPTNWPGTVSEYRRRTRRLDLGDYRQQALAVVEPS